MKKTPQKPQRAQLLNKTIRRTVRLRYLLYLPPGYDKTSRRWPLMLFLHGAGERGDNLDAVKVHGPPKLIEAGAKFPFIVVSPQCPPDMWWNQDLPALQLLLDDLARKYRVDESRLYVTGLSMGGFGTWAMALDQPDRFAAIAPICGGSIPLLTFKIKHVPAWVFHGGKDPVVPVAYSREMVAALRAAGGKPKFTVYPKAGHDSWTAAYKNPRFYQWLLKQKKRSLNK